MVLKLGHFESRSEIPGKLWNVVLEKDEEDQIDRSCEKWSITKSEEGEEYHTKIKRRKANWTGRILCRNCLNWRVMEGNIEGRVEVTGRRKKLLDGLKKKRGHWKLKEKALDRPLWRNRCGRAYGPVEREIREWIRKLIIRGLLTILWEKDIVLISLCIFLSVCSLGLIWV